MSTPVRIGVAGVGRIGSMHAQIIARQTQGAVLAGVADTFAATADSVAEDLRVPAMSVDELMHSADVDAVAICTSTDTHVDLIVQAAQAGKAIFAEKPISLELAQVDRALAAVDAAGVPFMVGFNRRFDPGHQFVHDQVSEGVIGDVHMARITSRDPAPPPIEYIKVSGGIFVDMTIHDFDMARYVVGSPVVEVFAKGAVRIDPAIGEAGDLDTAIVVLTHANGAITTIDNSRQAVYGYDQRVEVFGGAGMVVSENPRGHAGLVATDTRISGANLPYFFLERYTESYVREWAAFVNYVANGGPSPVSGNDGRAPVVIGLAAWQSIREGRPIAIDQG
jgi:myo-inositol 2-dehydrogenase / D-chiro-inositol 1-dehydrogenase